MKGDSNMTDAGQSIWATTNAKEKDCLKRRNAIHDPDYIEGLIEPVNLFGFDDPTPSEADRRIHHMGEY